MLTAVVVAPKVALDAPVAMVTEAGTITALLLLDKLTVVAVVAAAVSVTVQESVPAPVSELLLHESALSAGGVDVVDGFNCSVVVSETPFEVAVSVTVCVALTDDTVAVNGSLVSSVHTYIDEGTCTAALLLFSVTWRMPDVFRFIVTVQVVEPALAEGARAARHTGEYSGSAKGSQRQAGKQQAQQAGAAPPPRAILAIRQVQARGKSFVIRAIAAEGGRNKIVKHQRHLGERLRTPHLGTLARTLRARWA